VIRVALIVSLVLGCSKAPRSHEDAPASRPLDAQSMAAPPVDAAPLIDGNVDTRVVDAGRVDKPRPDAGTKSSLVDAGTKSSPKLGKLGDVCARGSRGRDLDEPSISKPVLECEPGLMCCYPCGIPGCDSVCKKTCPAVP
jgi:hypothetical protein